MLQFFFKEMHASVGFLIKTIASPFFFDYFRVLIALFVFFSLILCVIVLSACHLERLFFFMAAHFQSGVFA